MSLLLLLLLHCSLSNPFSGFPPFLHNKKSSVELRSVCTWNSLRTNKYKISTVQQTFYSTKSNTIIKPSFRIVFVATGIFNEKSGTDSSLLVYTSLSSAWFIFYWLSSRTYHFFYPNQFSAQVIIFIVKKVSTEGEYLLSYNRRPPRSNGLCNYW